MFRIALLVVAALLLIALAGILYVFEAHPSLGPQRMTERASAASGLTVTFLGVSTLLFNDGQAAILTDGFFSRPGPFRVLFGRITPDQGRIASCLQRAGITNLAADIVLHSHYDHGFDAPEVAKRTGAVLVGSESTANIGRGEGLPENRINLVRMGDTLTFGRFHVTFLPSKHAPVPTLAITAGEITHPITPPAHANDYKVGDCYSVLIEHDGRTMLVQGSAGYLAGTLENHQADVVFLGVAGLGRLSDDYRREYWAETAAAVGAKRVIPIHWDDFTVSLDKPLVPMSIMMDDFDAAKAFILGASRNSHVDLRWPKAFEKFDPFAGL